VCLHSARGSPSPPPRQRSVRRSPAVKRQSLEQRRATSSATPAQWKSPVPVPSPTPTSQLEEDAVMVLSEVSVPSASGGGVWTSMAPREAKLLVGATSCSSVILSPAHSALGNLQALLPDWFDGRVKSNSVESLILINLGSVIMPFGILDS
jgi:hypothetical protein